MARTFRRLAVTLPVTGVLLLFASTGPAAAAPGSDPPGDPHAAEAAGNPHADGDKGNPHDAQADDTTAGSDSSTASSDTTGANTDTGTTTESSTAVEPAGTSTASTSSSESVATESVTAAVKPDGTGGKPCDGCVGNADGKTPPGQSNNDKNKGHECDGNKGIGKGNPAHTGCTTTTTTTTTTTDSTTPTTSSTTPTTGTTTPGAQVLGETITRSPQVLGATATRAGALARTGGDPRRLTVAGLALVLLGAALMRRARVVPSAG